MTKSSLPGGADSRPRVHVWVPPRELDVRFSFELGPSRSADTFPAAFGAIMRELDEMPAVIIWHGFTNEPGVDS